MVMAPVDLILASVGLSAATEGPLMAARTARPDRMLKTRATFVMYVSLMDGLCGPR